MPATWFPSLCHPSTYHSQNYLLEQWVWLMPPPPLCWEAVSESPLSTNKLEALLIPTQDASRPELNFRCPAPSSVTLSLLQPNVTAWWTHP